MSIGRDAAAWLAMVGLVHLATPALKRWLAPTPEPVCRLLALVPVGLSAWAAHAWGLPPQPLTGPLEAMGTAAPLGSLGWLMGTAGWLVWAMGPRRAANPAGRAWWRNAVAALPLLAWPYTLLPPWAIDETSYHLGLPMHARVTGHLAAPLGHGNGGFYALGEWVGAWGLAMGSVAAARGVQMLALCLSAHAALSLLAPPQQRRFVVAWLLWLAAPAALWQLPTSYVDLLLSTFVGVAALCAARLHRAAPADTPAWARCCGLLLGAAIATKPTAAVLLPALAWTRARRPRRVAVTALISAILVPLPFAAYDLWHYHTPLFPFVAAWWPSASDLLPAQRDVLVQFFDQHGPTFNGVPAAGIMRFVLLPWGLCWQARFASPCFDGVLGAALLLIMAGALAHRWQRPRAVAVLCVPAAKHIAAQWATVLGLTWFLTSWQARFLLPTLHLALLAWALALPPIVWRPRTLAWILAMVAAQCAYWPRLAGHVPPLLLARLSTDAARASVRREWSAPSGLCEGAEMAGARVALVWTQRQLLYCPQAIVADSYDEGARLDAWLSFDDGAAHALAQLRGLGITHLIVNEALWQNVDPQVPPEERVRAQHIARQWQALKGDWLVPQAQVRGTVRFHLRPSPRA